MYLGNDGGIWRTDDAEALTITWTNLNDSLLTLTQFYPSISINTSSPSIAFAGTQDNGSQNYQGGVSWVDNHQCGDGGSTAVDAVVPSTVYIGCATGYPVNASYQNGTVGTFSPAVNGIDPTDPSDFIPPLATDPNTANLLYFGTTKIYQSFDAANTWMPRSRAAGLRSRRLADSNRGRAGEFQRCLHRIKRWGSLCRANRYHAVCLLPSRRVPHRAARGNRHRNRSLRSHWKHRLCCAFGIFFQWH